MSARSLGLLPATALVVGNMVGVGVLLTPRLVAKALPDVGAFVALWLLGGLVAAAGSATYAELGSRLPEAGGDVAFQDRALGRPIALATGTLMAGAAFAASIAAISVAIGTWQVPTLLGLPAPADALPAKAVGICVIAGLTAANLLGLRVGAWVQVATTALPVAALAALAGVALVGPAAATAAVPAADGGGAPGSLVEAFSGVYFAYAGWPAVVYLAGEVRDPARTLPRAMLGGTAMVTALYLLLTLAFVHTLGMGGLQQTFEAGSALVTALFGAGAGRAMSAVVLVALLASVNATVLGGARVAVALARRGALPAALATVDERGVPRNALLAQAVVAAAIVLSGSFDQIVEASVLAMLVIGSLTVVSLFVLRRRQHRFDGYRATAWPLPGLVYLGVGAAVLIAGIAQGLSGEGPPGALATLGLLAVLVAGFTVRERLHP